VSVRKDTARTTGLSVSNSGYGAFVTPLFFAAVLAVYLVTLINLYPNMPVIARMAESIPGYDTNYPPFRVDEYNYNTIAKSLLTGDIYRPDSLERSYTIGFPVVAAPFIAVFGNIGGYVANALIIWGGLLLFYGILRRDLSRGKSLIVTAILAFATLDWFYAASCYTEPLAQLLALGSWYLLVRGSDESTGPAWWAAAGAATALNLFVRPHYILLAVQIGAYLVIRLRKEQSGIRARITALVTAAVVVTVAWMIRNAIVFGGPATFEYSRLVDSYVPGSASSYMKGNVFLGIHRLLFDQYHGLLPISPILLVFPAGLRTMWCKGKRGEVVFLGVSVGIMAFFATASAYPFTEFGLGSRHLVPIIPFMMIPCAYFLDGSRFARGMVTVLVVYSFYQSGIGWFTGGEPGRGFFLGILNEAQSRAIILARKGVLPKRTFASEQELVDTFLTALNDADMWRLLQTLHPLVIEKIRGNERTFMLYLRGRPHPAEFILSADPDEGIVIKSFSVSGQSSQTEGAPEEPPDDYSAGAPE